MPSVKRDNYNITIQQFKKKAQKNKEEKWNNMECTDTEQNNRIRQSALSRRKSWKKKTPFNPNVQFHSIYSIENKVYFILISRI